MGGWAGAPRGALFGGLWSRITQTLKVSLRLVNADGAREPIPDGTPAMENQLPLRQIAPTTTWVPGERVRDVYESTSAAIRICRFFFPANYRV